MKTRKRCLRSYVLALRPNAGKAEEARYAIWWATRWCLDYVRELYVQAPNATRSTAGLGQLNHHALKRARDMLRAGRAAARATGQPFVCPSQTPVLADTTVTRSRNTRAPLWVKVPRGPYIPAEPHRALMRALRAGAVLREGCELRSGRRGGLVARVIVEYPHRPAMWSRDCLGMDVGVNVGVAQSDGHIGQSLRPILERARQKRAAQCKQGHHRSGTRSAVKQHLDREARRVVTLAAQMGRSIAIERLKTLGNLKPPGSIAGWARRHFGERTRQIAEEVGVSVIEVHPAYTSTTCLRCGTTDPENRRGVAFRCVQCGAYGHADRIAARNIARKARGAWFTPRKKAARKTRSACGVQHAS